MSTVSDNLIEQAWGIIANAGGGDWAKESKDWKEAAARFRGQYHAWLDSQGGTSAVRARENKAGSYFKLRLEIHDADGEGGELEVFCLEQQGPLPNDRNKLDLRPQAELIAITMGTMLRLAQASGSLTGEQERYQGAAEAFVEDGYEWGWGGEQNVK